MGFPYEIKCELVQTVSIDKLLKNPMTDKDYEDVGIFEGIDLYPRKDGGFKVLGIQDMTEESKQLQ